MNEKFKLIFADATGKTTTITESHPNLDSTPANKEGAMQSLGELLGKTAIRMDLNSDTTVWQAD